MAPPTALGEKGETMNDSPLPDVAWDIRREGRAWNGDEWKDRRELRPEKIEMTRGMLFWSEEDRLNMLAMLLENVGADQAVRLGDPRVWREAVARRDGLNPDVTPATRP